MTAKKRRLLLLIPLLVMTWLFIDISGCAYITGEAVKIPAAVTEPVIRDISPAEAYALIQANAGNAEFVIIDVRTPEEYAGGHIIEAVNIDFNSATFRNDVDKLDKEKTYLIYCRSGKRSAAARDAMAALGFRDIYNMTGGILDWDAEDLPVVK